MLTRLYCIHSHCREIKTLTSKDSYLILDTLPCEYDSRVKAMEVDTRPTEQYSDIGGLDKQIQELIEAVVLPMTHKERWAWAYSPTMQQTKYELYESVGLSTSASSPPREC